MSDTLFGNLPLTGAEKPSQCITLNKAVQLMNARGTVSAVQKAGRNDERAKKRKADEMVAGGGSGTAIALGLGTSPGALGELTVRNTRAAAARGREALNRGRGGPRGRGRGRGLRRGRSSRS